MAPSLIFGTKDLLKHGALQKSGVNNANYEEEFQVAETFESTTFEHPETKELLDFIEYLFVVHHTKRTDRLEALQHPYLDALP